MGLMDDKFGREGDKGILGIAGIDLDAAQKTAVQFINIDSVVVNEYNKIYDDQVTIEDLAADIKETGLINPLYVLQQNNDGKVTYKIISGNSRYLACKLLIEQGNSIFCNGRNCGNQIPCFVTKSFENDFKEKTALISANFQRELSTTQKVKICKELELLYEQGKKLGVIVGVTKADWIATKINVSRSTIFNYLNDVIKTEEENIIDDNGNTKVIRKETLKARDYSKTKKRKAKKLTVEDKVIMYSKYIDELIEANMLNEIKDGSNIKTIKRALKSLKDSLNKFDLS